jgi:Putative peptidoglycan binding domain/Fungal chitosanase of glycosyl hydrolase group 75
MRKPGKQPGVGTVQRALNRLGERINFGPGNRNLGVFGPQTEDAVDVFQGRAGVGVDGQVGRDTIAVLDNALMADEDGRTGEGSRGRDSDPGRVSERTDSTPHLFDFAQGLLEAAQGIPWSKARRMPTLDNHSGAASGSCYAFRNLTRMPNNVSSAVFYGCKLAIDNDGSGGNAAGDPAHKNATTLRDVNGLSLDAGRDIFAVLPMDAGEAEEAHRDNPAIALKHAGLPDFSRELGLKLGDLGVAFWRHAGSGSVNRTFFIYGDKGPANKLGEGSVRMADELRIPSNPNTGGLDASEVADLRKGVIHIAFPGSGAPFLAAGHVNRTTLNPGQVATRAEELFEVFKSQTA